MARIMVAMSGGVDSSVAALLCLRGGHEVSGGTMALSATSADGAAEAAGVAAMLGIPHRVYDFAAEFERAVVSRFCCEYAGGRTPNPCVVCNAEIKFGLLLREAVAAGAEYMATGHYVRLGRSHAGRLTLLKGTDDSKDQSYALYGLSQGQLARAEFPLGGLTKREVRRIAAEAGLPVADRPESQDLCFATSDGYRSLLAERVGDGLEPGPVLDTRGNIVGRHEGIANFTVGQRKGLGVTSREPLYVLAIRPADRAVVVGPASETFSRGLVATACNWMAIPGLPAEPIRAEVKVRYGSRAVPSRIRPGARPGETEVVFEEPQRSVTPGQAAVFYCCDELLGGGTIDRALPAVAAR